MLPPGVDWRPELGETARPIGAEVRIDSEQLPTHPRRSRDGTPYCVACPRTLRENSRAQRTLCDDCTAERTAFRARRYRRRRTSLAAEHSDPITVDRDDVRELLQAVAHLQRAVGGAIARQVVTSDEWGSRLLSAAKSVDVRSDCLRRASLDTNPVPASGPDSQPAGECGEALGPHAERPMRQAASPTPRASRTGP